MFIVRCPYCGERDQTEFSCHGEAHIARPTDTQNLSDDEWGNYVFFRQNPKGMHYERWLHVHGCGRWFNALRNTATDEIHATYKIGEAKPAPLELPS